MTMHPEINQTDEDQMFTASFRVLHPIQQRQHVLYDWTPFLGRTHLALT